MITALLQQKRLGIGIALFLMFGIGAMTNLEQILELTGVLLLFSAAGSLLYLLMFYLFFRNKMASRIPYWQRREVLGLASLLGLIALIGLGETLAQWQENNTVTKYYPFFFIFYVELLLISSIFLYQNGIKPKAYSVGNQRYVLPKRWYYAFAIGNVIALIIFNDYWGENELFLIFVFFYFPIVLFLSLRWFFTEIKTLLSLRTEKTKAELMHLQNQVNPHFFFNILNSLYGWVAKDPATAQALILQLSDMMRYSIYEGQKDWVSLEEEITYLQNYIALHQMRYLKKIAIRFEQDIQVEKQKLRPLLFIILVENAFKHGVENLRKEAFVSIRIESRVDRIDFWIENNFDPSLQAKPEGIGLHNLKRRLVLAYPDKHELHLMQNENIFKAHLSLYLAR